MITGYTTGVFDMFHVGHLRLLQRAREQCDRLVVGVTTDELSATGKGKKPIIPFSERVEIVSSLRCVDDTVAQATMDKFSAWKQWGFDRMFVGNDWKGSDTWNRLEAQFSPHNVEIIYLPYTQHTSSTVLRETLERLHGLVD